VVEGEVGGCWGWEHFVRVWVVVVVVGCIFQVVTSTGSGVVGS